MDPVLGDVPAADAEPAPDLEVFPGGRRGAAGCRSWSARSWPTTTPSGPSFYGVAVDRFLPFNFLRDVHIQTPIVWIGVVLDRRRPFPRAGDQRPRGERPGAVGRRAVLRDPVGGRRGSGRQLPRHHGLHRRAAWFWFGNQGLSYIQLGRAWQIGFFAGLAIWSVLVLRALWPTRASLCGGDATILARRHPAREPAVGLDRQHRPPLCVRHDPAHRDREVLHHHRLLALVGGPSVGRAVVRVLRRCDERLPADGGRPGVAQAGRARGLSGTHPDLPGWRPWHRPPPLLGRRARHVGAARYDVLVHRGPAVGAARHRGDPAAPADQGGGQLQVRSGLHLHHRRGLLELRRRGRLRRRDVERAVGELLRARHLPDPEPRPHGALRRVRPARHRA